MKFILITIGVLVILFLILQIFIVKSQRNIETYPFSIIKKFENFEIRKYESSLFSSVKISSKDYKKASNQGFSILASYIFGNNQMKEKISMTSPVSVSLEDSMEVMFMVPKKFNQQNLPKPNDSRIKLNEEPEKKVAAISFGGWADNEKIEKYKAILVKSLKEKKIKHTNQFYFLGYNPPYEVFNRKNEIIVVLDEKE